MRLSAGINQIGGKWRLLNDLKANTPMHDYFVSLFCGAMWYELNKARCKYELANDLDSEYINYLLMVKEYPEEFDKMKTGVFSLLSQEIFNRIVNGDITPKNNIERAYFFYYLIKLGFSGSNSGYRGLTQPTVLKEKSTNESIQRYRGISPKVQIESKEEIEKKKASTFRGNNIKTTRPYTNQDSGLLTPLDPRVIQRLQYINIVCYDFKNLYKRIFKSFYTRKNLTIEVLIYADPPYPSTEQHYKNTTFVYEDHLALIDIMLETPFRFMLSIGGDCEFYLDAFEWDNRSLHCKNNWFITPVKVKYSTDARSQTESTEYIITNYDMSKIPIMKEDSMQKRLNQFF